MHTPILMPQMGQSVAEGTIVRWHKQPGDEVRLDEVLLEVESDKISTEVESPAAGRLHAVLKKEGERAAVGERIGLLTVDQPAGESMPSSAPAGKPHAGADQEQVLVSSNPDFNPQEWKNLPDISRDWYSPYVLRLAMENRIGLEELQSIRGTGRQGRVTRTDLLKYLARRGGERAAVAPSPATGVPAHLNASGEVIPMTTMRRTIADHMVQSIRTSAHVTMVHAVDMTHIVALRERVKDEFFRRYGVKMTYTMVMIFVTARVLKEFPTLNGSVHGSHIVRHREINIGCAVALPDESLVVPVVKGADRRTFPELAQEFERLVGTARRRELAREDVEEGTFTISNFGAFGSLIGTPIIHQPQVAILGMGAVFKAPVVMGNEICVRDQVYLSLSFDHRVIDGAMGGRFLNAIQKATEALTERDLDLAAL